ncbi:hypothetical protein KAR91_68165 [Candidatus Pacearchaeota archaeon]|nr:hypothetical protein [Candidatus Pacearchaeota archaeon]
MIELGGKVKDKVTGVSGIVTGHCKYLTGCDQYLVQPVDRKDKLKVLTSAWFDVNRLEVVRSKKIILDVSKDKGCCEPAPIK